MADCAGIWSRRRLAISGLRSALISKFLRKPELDCSRFPFLEVEGKIIIPFQTKLLYETIQMTRSRVKTLGAGEILQSYKAVLACLIYCPN